MRVGGNKKAREFFEDEEESMKTFHFIFRSVNPNFPNFS
jgi:hypothetical protein